MRSIALFLFGIALLFSSCSEEEVETVPETGIAEIEIPTRFDTELFPFEKDGKYGYMDRFGKIRLAPEYDQARYFSEGLGAVQVNGLWGFINHQGLYRIPLAFSEVSAFRESKAVAAVKQKKGFIDHNGKFVIDTLFDEAYPFREGLATVEMKGKSGVINAKGEWKVIPIYPLIMPFSEGKALLLDTSGLFGYIDTSGSYVIPPVFTKAWPFSDGKASVKMLDKWGYLNHDGRFAIDMEAESCWPFAEQRALVFKDKKWGIVDTSGNWVVPPEYDDAWEFNEGMAAVQKNGLWGCIDVHGKVVIPIEHKTPATFRNGLAMMETDSGQVWINHKGFVMQAGVRNISEAPLDTAPNTTVVAVLESDVLPAIGTNTPSNSEVVEDVDKPLVSHPVTNPVPIGAVIKQGNCEILPAWERGKVPLARFIANYMADEWQGSPLLIPLGVNGSKYYFVQAFVKDGNIVSELVILTKSGDHFRNDIVGPDIKLVSTNAELIRRKLLNNLWHWDGEGVLDHKRLRSFDPSIGSESDDFSMKIGEGSGAIRLTFDGESWKQH